MLEQGEILKLTNDKEYVVVSSITYKEGNYVYLIDTETYKDYKLLKYENERLKVVKDESLLKTLITMFNNDLKDNLATLINND